MIFVAMGANLPHPEYGPPVETLSAALAALEEYGVSVVRRSRWYRTAPVPLSDQPWFVNGVAEVDTDLSAEDLLATLHRVEARFGRVRHRRLEPRIVDLDLISFNDLVRPAAGSDEGLVLPHPRMHQRAFVLLPLAELAPDWRHPRLGIGIETMIARLDPTQMAELLPEKGSQAS